MSDTQLLTIALAAAPTMLAVLVGILISNSRLNDTNTRIAELRIHMDTRFTDVERRFDGVDRRFDEMRDLWRSELHRVEEVLDARLKHLEDRGRSYLVEVFGSGAAQVKLAASSMLPEPLYFATCG
jgi:hypothetical protein